MSKEYVVGETIGSGNQNSTTLAEIYDMSAFEFKMTIDDLDIDSLAKGQEVVVTSSARSGYKWYGTVTNISVQGTTQNGATSYPVTVTIYNEEDTDKRKIDEDGTIHKFYKSGKISTVKTYVLEEKADSAENSSDQCIYIPYTIAAKMNINTAMVLRFLLWKMKTEKPICLEQKHFVYRLTEHIL